MVLLGMEDTQTIRCVHDRDCGACALLGVGYVDQLRGKRAALRKAVSSYPTLKDAEVLPCIPSIAQEGYRNRAKMAIGMSKRDALRVGYFRSGTREIVDAPDCRVLVPEVLETTRGIRRYLQTTPGVPRELRHVDVRCGSDPKRQHLTLVFRSKVMPTFPLDALREACPKVDGISVNLNPTKGPQVIRGSITPLWGAREVWVDHAGSRLRVSPAAFFQVNLAMLPAIHERMEVFFKRGDVLADLYAGVGTHGLALSPRFRRVLFAEGNRSAIADLKSTIRGKGSTNFRISPVAVERSLDRLNSEGPDAVVLNPSRAGALPRVLDAVARTPAKKLAYLSCDPQTLCRDLDILRRQGFRMLSIQPIDMMPQTRQVEALALLTR
jgi:23S rRNA (uracil1939-C5)-methyltransferase